MSKISWFTLKRVQPRIYALAEFYHWGKVVSYLILGNTKAVLIDSGMGYADIKEAVKKITNLPVEVLLTHGHWDHIGGAGAFSSVSIYNDAFDKKLLQGGFRSSEIVELREKKYFREPYQPQQHRVKGLKKFTTLKEGEIIDCGDLHIQVIHTAGHTPGSTCYLIKELNIICTGDTIYPGPLYTHLPESDLMDYSHSLLKLNQLCSPETLLLPGHNAVSCPLELLSEAYGGIQLVLAKKLNGQALGRRVKEYKLKGISIIARL